VTEKIARLFDMHAHLKQRIDQASAGDNRCRRGLKESVTGDTLTDAHEALVSRPSTCRSR
jgi:translation elongation factor EF-G